MTTPAVLLRGHDYGDTSRILRFYTRDHGLLGVMARGVRGQSGKGTTAIASFATGSLTAYLKAGRDLHTMKDFACTHMREGIAHDVVRFAGASALAELLLAHVDTEPHPELFETLEASLDALEDASPEEGPAAAISALWRLTEGFGFAPELHSCVRCGRELGEEEVGRFDFGAGGMRCADCSDESTGPRVGPVARAQIGDLAAGQLRGGLAHPRRHLGLLGDFLAYHVVSKPLKSFHFLGSVLPEDEPVVG